MEAARLARMTAERLGCSAAEARRNRCEVLQSHLAVQGSRNRLCSRVKEILGEVREPEIVEGICEVVDLWISCWRTSSRTQVTSFRRR